jgi:hypothetical protein
MTAILNAGRELDALIAQKVMGQNYFINSFGFPEQGPLVSKEPPHYSTDIAAAWEIVQEMEKKHTEPGKWVGLSITAEDRGCWRATFWRKWSFGSSAPHAICLAALEAVRYQPEST